MAFRPDPSARERPDTAAPGSGRSDATFAEEIGRRVRQGRAKRGMTRRQLSQDSGTSERYLAQIESGIANPSVIVMRSIADALGLPAGCCIPAYEDNRILVFIRSTVTGL